MVEATSKTIEDIFPDIESAWKDFKTKRIKQTPTNNLRASSVGYECERRLYYSIHDWKEQPLHDVVLQSIFDEGKEHEKIVMRELSEIGFEIVEQQRSFQIDKPLLTGSVDGILRYEGKKFPFDIKTINQYDFEKLVTAEDLTCSKKSHQRNYVAQLQLYMLMSNNEHGFLLLKNKLTGEWKCIRMTIDYDFCEKILKKAERVYASLKNETPPDRINDFDVCMKCPFRHICLPDLAAGPGVQVIDDVELAGLLERREQLAESAKEYKTIDEQIKESVTAGGPGEKVCAGFLIRVKKYMRKVKVALTWDEKEEPYFRTQIVRLEKQ